MKQSQTELVSRVCLQQREMSWNVIANLKDIALASMRERWETYNVIIKAAIEGNIDIVKLCKERG